MGQKINPLGFRLGTTQSHHSVWFAEPKQFSVGLQEDKSIRDCIKNFMQKSTKMYSDPEGIVRIEIKKEIDLIEVLIYMAFPNLLLEEDRREIGELKGNVEKKIMNPVYQKLNITIKRIEEPYGQPKILAQYIASQLKERVPFRKAMKKAIELIEDTKTDINGIQIQMAGRFDGKEKARVEWIREGRVPLQTIRAKIDYCSYTVPTIHGSLGIKIWIFIDEE
uniref:ribosomal protein S3 n=1 Tax=Hydrocharis dubia TaxID=62340 RepID=UPI001F13E9AC|nr:ribosomal protein S3 [Hydrocharis dubia]UKT60912.1 ribosomal protein S3 [Hydrocharis dubia]